MKVKITLLFCLSLYVFEPVKAQTTQDTIEHPHWIQMMQDHKVNLKQTKRAFELYWSNKPIQKGSGWKAFKRWEWMAEKVVDANGDFPDAYIQSKAQQDLIERDFNHFDSLYNHQGIGSAPCKTYGNWKRFGPNALPINNTGQMNGMGRVNAVAIHPTDSNTIYAGAAAGGIWKSIDGGNSWTVNSDSLPTLGVSAIAITKQNPNIMYFGSGDRDAGDAAGYGVFKSTNAGTTWFIQNTGMGNRKVGRLIIDPNNPNVLIAACEGGIYRTVNAGANWTLVLSGSFFKDIVFKPNNSKVVYASNNGLIYRSMDNGITWTNLSNGLPTTGVSRASIDVNVNNPNLVYVWIANGSVHKGFYLSRDTGNFFRTQSTTPNLHDYSTNGSGNSGQAWYDMDMVTDPKNQAIVYCGGVNVFRSDDTGKTWTIAGYWVNKIHADQHELIADPLSKKIYAGNDGGLYSSRNNGVSWQVIGNNLAIAQIYKMASSRTRRDILINGYQDNGTANYNKNWYTTYGGDGMDCEIDQTDDRYSYGELYYGSIYRIFNVNAQATIANNGYTAAGSDTINESGSWVTPFTLKEGSGNTMFIGYTNIWRSNNIKTSPVLWKRISFNLGGVNNSNFNELESNIANPDILYAARYNGTLFRTDNVNATSPTWTTLTKPITGLVNAIETDPKSQNIVYIGIGNKVYKSTNKGANWTQVLSNLAYNVSAILLDTSSAKKGLYVGTSGGGVWYTDSTIGVWKYFSKGLPNTVNITDLDIYYEPNKKCNCSVIYASTYNQGNFSGSLYSDGTQKPYAFIDAFDSIACVNSVFTIKQKSCNNPTVFNWSFSTKDVIYLNNTDSSSETPSVKFNKAGTYSYQLIVENCNGADTVLGKITATDTVIRTCIPSTTNNFGGLGIYNVTMSNINRSSGDRVSEGAYVDVSCSQTIKVKRGKFYTLQVTTGQWNKEQVKAFIDFNSNGTMTDAGELVYQPAAAMINHLDSIWIPQNLVPGKTYRMRIRSDFNSLGVNPCSTLNYGQTEDYTLYIEPDFKPMFTSSKRQICPNDQVLISDSSAYSGFNYVWNFGANAQPSSASGKGPHLVKFKQAGYPNIQLSIDKKVSEMDSALKVDLPPNISIQILQSDSNRCNGQFLKLKVFDTNAVSANYQWYFKGVAIKDSILNQLRYAKISLKDSGVYAVIAQAFCSDTAYKTIKVHPNPIVQFTINDSTQCKRSNLFVSNNLSTISKGTLKYNWSFSDNYKDTAKNTQHGFNTQGNYWVKLRVVSDKNCMDSMRMNLQVYEQAKADFSIASAQAQCFKGNRFNLVNQSSLSSGSLYYLWQFGNNTNGSSTATTSNINGLKYLKYDSVYAIKLIANTTNNCSDSISKIIQLRPQLQWQIRANDSIQCYKHNQFAFNNTSKIAQGTYNLNWDFGDLTYSSLKAPIKQYNATGPFLVKVYSNSNYNCKDSFLYPLKVIASPNANFTIDDSIQCINQHSFALTDVSSYAGTYLRKWFHPILDPNQGSIITVKYTDTGKQAIQLVVLADNTCTDTIVKTVYVAPLPAFTVWFKDSLCLFDSLHLMALPMSNSYQWQVNQTNIGNFNQVVYMGNQIGWQSLKLQARSIYGCIDTLSVKQAFNVLALPVVKWKDSIGFNEPNLVLKFSDISPGNIINRWWYFSNGQSGNALEETINPFSTDSLTVKLRVEDQNHCFNQLIEYYQYPLQIWAPNIFTPNNDGLNDVFKVYGLHHFKTFHMSIYDRWGALIYETTDSRQGWNGEYKQEAVPTGSYVYMIQYTNADQSKGELKGSVSLRR